MRFKIPKLSYKQKTLRNIVMMILLFVFVWMNEDYPMPTAEMNFRRLERRLLLGGSEIVLRIPGGTGDEIFVSRGETHILVAEADRRDTAMIGYWSLGELLEIKLFPVGTYAYMEETGTVRAVRGAAALDMPEEAYRAELFVECEGTVYRAEGEKCEGGVWLFTLTEGYILNSLTGESYELMVYDAQNQPLLRQEGVFPKSEL